MERPSEIFAMLLDHMTSSKGLLWGVGDMYMPSSENSLRLPGATYLEGLHPKTASAKGCRLPNKNLGTSGAGGSARVYFGLARILPPLPNLLLGIS